MFDIFKRKETLIITADNSDTKLYPGDKYILTVNLDFSKNNTTIFLKAPITFLWDGTRLVKIDGP